MMLMIKRFPKKENKCLEKKKHEIFNILYISYCGLAISYYVLYISYYVLDEYSLVLVLNRMSKKLKIS
jgi:hypothetical protein